LRQSRTQIQPAGKSGLQIPSGPLPALSLKDFIRRRGNGEDI
jgi:hypothetical protein